MKEGDRSTIVPPKPLLRIEGRSLSKYKTSMLPIFAIAEKIKKLLFQIYFEFHPVLLSPLKRIFRFFSHKMGNMLGSLLCVVGILVYCLRWDFFLVYRPIIRRWLKTKFGRILAMYLVICAIIGVIGGLWYSFS